MILHRVAPWCHIAAVYLMSCSSNSVPASNVNNRQCPLFSPCGAAVNTCRRKGRGLSQSLHRMPSEIQQWEVEGERMLWSPSSNSADVISAIFATLPWVSPLILPLSSLTSMQQMCSAQFPQCQKKAVCRAVQ